MFERLIVLLSRILKKEVIMLEKFIIFKENLRQLSYWYFISLLLFIVFIVALFFHVIFSVGLDYDGSFILGNMIFSKSFSFFETSRLFFHFLYQLPAWLFIRFSSSDSLSLLTQVFSFGLIGIHIFSLIGCWLISFCQKIKKALSSFLFLLFLLVL